MKETMDSLQEHLSIAKDLGDRAEEGRSYNNLGVAYLRLGDYEQAIVYLKQHLSIAKDLGDRAEEGFAYDNIGSAYHKRGDNKQAIEYHEQHLSITKDLGDRANEGLAYNKLGDAYYDMGDYERAIEYHKQHLSIAKDLGDRTGEGRAYNNLGGAYYKLDDYKRAIEYLKQYLSITKDLGNRAGEGLAYNGLGAAYYYLGDDKEAIEYHKQHLSIAKDLGDRAAEGRAYNNIGVVYGIVRDFKQAMNYLKLCLVIAKDFDDKTLESSAYNSIGCLQRDLGDSKKAIEYFEKLLAISNELGTTEANGYAYMNLGSAYSRHLGDFKQAIEYQKQGLSIFEELNMRHMEGSGCFYLGKTFELSGALQEAADYYQRSIEIFNKVRDCLQYEDAWKVTFCKTYHEPYTGLCRTLVKLLKFDEALCVTEQGRAQALADLIKLQYDSELSAPSSFDPKAAISSMISDMSTPTLFVALEENTIYLWLLCKGRNIQFTQKEVKYPLGDVAYYLERLRKDAYKEILGGFRVICENRSLDELREEEEPPSTEEIRPGAVNSSQNKSNSLHLFPELIEGGGEVQVKCENRLLNELREQEDLPPTKEIGAGTGTLSHRKSNSLHLFHECIIDPISELIEGDELIVVPDGPLCLAPFAAFLNSESKYLSESMKIRILPSLTSLKLIEVSPEDYHGRSGALLVGEPCLEQFTSLLGRPIFSPLPNARKEVEMIGKMLGIQPVTGKEATKAEVLRRISSVAVVHIAAHGEMKTGDILLAPNPEQASIDREEKGYRLTISDVQAAKMRAKLVVLSCCHSAQGEVSSEGVVGIARAFLGAGARSVLVSLWAIDDTATFEFMRIFYKHLKDGNSASVSLNRAMNCLRESDEFGAVRFWAPFVLIGDDVTIDFGENQ